jgi:hypothetical protein
MISGSSKKDALYQPLVSQPERSSRMKCTNCHDLWMQTKSQGLDKLWEESCLPLLASLHDERVWLEQYQREQEGGTGTGITRLEERHGE